MRAKVVVVGERSYRRRDRGSAREDSKCRRRGDALLGVAGLADEALAVHGVGDEGEPSEAAAGVEPELDVAGALGEAEAAILRGDREVEAVGLLAEEGDAQAGEGGGAEVVVVG